MNTIETVNEFLYLKEKMHKSLHDELEKGIFRNGTEIEDKGSYTILKVTIHDDSLGTSLFSYGTLTQKAKYSMKVFVQYLPLPFRLEIDNNWSAPHINSYCPSDNHLEIPNWGTQNLSAIGSTIMGQSIDNQQMGDLIRRHIEWGLKN